MPVTCSSREECIQEETVTPLEDYIDSPDQVEAFNAVAEEHDRTSPDYWRLRIMSDYNTAVVDAVAHKLASARRDLAVATQLAKEQAVLMRDCGESEYMIADMLGVTRTTVRSWLGK